MTSLAAQMPAAVLFDLDGTLVDSVPDLARAVDQMLEALGRAPAGVELVRQWVGNGAEVLVKRALGRDMEGSLNVDDAELFPVARDLFFGAYAQANGRSSQIYPGVEAALEWYREQGTPMAVVTNKPGAFTDQLLAQLGLAGYFAVVVAGDTLAEKKPSAAPLLHACDRLGQNAAAALMVGDSSVDVAAARAAGCPVVCVSYGYNKGAPISEAGADRVIDSLVELIR
ncbi:phosphoglycolate phosphatase [Marinobacterium lutimaris]|uniref:Phosphoglycolate phosphatase n=1 Tax=Marinobacterium lutimaris TaxID=568106 RepID=A0A1H6B2A0_9GAMM|nr:phosphoglycolate phosphatase [Marinobacterium lutimaris]SEG54357.1 phosphoglycolate phosphatase [Marinobacterium lutimaris]